MLIIGAGGLVLQMIDDLEEQFGRAIVFWEDIPSGNSLIKEKFKIINHENEILKEFEKDRRFILGVGNPSIRKKMTEKFINYGGELTTLISNRACVSEYATIGKGSVILNRAIIEATAFLGVGCLVNIGAIITHGCYVGDYVEIAPAVLLTGNIKVGNSVFIGSCATILPACQIGEESIIGACALVNKNVLAKTVVFGIPAKEYIK